MDKQLDDFNARAARRNERRDQLRPDEPRKPESWGENTEGYFLILGVFYGGAAALFGAYCMLYTPQVGERLSRGDLEFATLRYIGGYWLYLFAPTVILSIAFGMSRVSPFADALRAFGLSAALVSAAIYALTFVFGG